MFSLRDVVTASALVLILVGSAAGALIGMILDTFDIRRPLLAVVTAVLALLAAELGRHFSIGLLIAGPAPVELPRVVFANGIIASLIGGLAAHTLGVIAFGSSSAILIGSLSGLLASLLMVLLMVTFHGARSRL